MKNIDLTEEQLEQITAGIPNMSKEELQDLKNTIKNLPKDYDESELDVNTLESVVGGPVPSDYAESVFEENVGKRSK